MMIFIYNKLEYTTNRSKFKYRFGCIIKIVPKISTRSKAFDGVLLLYIDLNISQINSGASERNYMVDKFH